MDGIHNSVLINNYVSKYNNKDEFVLTKSEQFLEFASMGQIRNELLLGKISEKIKKLRKEKGVTLEEFFNDTNIHLSRLEHSKANITVSTLKEICQYFGVSLHEFFKDIDK